MTESTSEQHGLNETEAKHQEHQGNQDLLAILDSTIPEPPDKAGEGVERSDVALPESEVPDRIATLLELVCDQQLQIASKLEEILELMNGPSEEGVLEKLAQLLAPIVNDTAVIKQHLGAA